MGFDLKSGLRASTPAFDQPDYGYSFIPWKQKFGKDFGDHSRKCSRCHKKKASFTRAKRTANMGVEKQTIKEGDGTNFPKKGDELTMVSLSADVQEFAPQFYAVVPVPAKISSG